MRALDRKLLRDFRRLWAQALAIALVLACGVAVLLMSIGMSRAMDDTRAAYYERNRFADVFSAVRRAPNSLASQIAAIEGVYAVETRIARDAVLDIPGRTQTAVGRILSLPTTGLPRLNVPLLRSGRWPAPESSDEVVVNAPFAAANGFLPGDSFLANLNGSKRALTITGTALSPEFIYTIGPGALMPDNEGFGIIWMPERAAAAAFDMTGAFTSVSVKIGAGVQTRPVIDALDDILDPYGGFGAFDRGEQESNAFIDAEIEQLRSMAYILPPVFLGITMFLVNMVIGRIVTLERSEIGLLKALGYSDWEVCLHYVLLAGLIAVVGILAGFAVGGWLAHAMAELYAQFFDFPYLIFNMSPGSYVAAGLLGFLAATLGSVRSALAAARLAPAVAMSPPAPPRFKRGYVDRLLAWLRVSQPTMMILRSILRWPIRSGLTTLGLALAVAVLVASNFFEDSLYKIVDTAFNQSNRQDAMLLFAEDVSDVALEEVRRLPGILQVEGQQFHAAILRNGHLEKRVPVEARPPDTDLSRIVDSGGNPIATPGNGMILAQRLATQLDVQVGDTVEAEFLSGRRETYQIPVEGTVTQYFGMGAYMDSSALNRLFRQSPRISVANITYDIREEEALHAATKDLPRLTGMIMMNENRRSFEDTISQNVLIANTVYAVLGILITIGVAYNGARVQLSERARELASLRILGFTRGEVSYILVGETMLLALAAQPLGWLIGFGVASAMTAGFSSDLYVIPLVLKPATFSYASLIVLGAALGAVLLVRRRLDRMDLVAVMKTRE